MGTEYYTGQVLKPLDRTFKALSLGIEDKAPEEALNGRVKYRGVDRSEVEVPFGEKDQVNKTFDNSWVILRYKKSYYFAASCPLM